MRRFFGIFTFLVGLTGILSLTCTSKYGERGRCINLYNCVPGFNTFKLNGEPPDPGDCPSQMCCVEKFKGLKIHEKRCMEYFLSAFEEAYVAPNDPEDPPVFTRLDRCTKKSTSFIVGGENADDHEFPHMASIGDDSTSPITWFCGGSLISDKFVLTAAHCFYGRSEAKVVRLGVNNLLDNANANDVRVERVISHPGYRDKTVYNDVAVIKLAQRVTLKPHIRPACLPSEPLAQAGVSTLQASGWGTTEHGGLRSNDLQKAQIDIFNHDECKNIFGKRYLALRQGVNENLICLLDPKREKDTCQGDSGGPIQTVSPKVYCSDVVYGITSAGVGCANEKGIPTLYTNVYNYVEWINSVVWG